MAGTVVVVDLLVPFTCEKCGYKFDQSLCELEERKRTVSCPRCGQPVKASQTRPLCGSLTECWKRPEELLSGGVTD